MESKNNYLKTFTVLIFFFSSFFSFAQSTFQIGQTLNTGTDPDVVCVADINNDGRDDIVATSGTAKVLSRSGIPVKTVFKIHEGRPDILDMIRNGEINIIINTPAGKATKVDETKIRSLAFAPLRSTGFLHRPMILMVMLNSVPAEIFPPTMSTP